MKRIVRAAATLAAVGLMISAGSSTAQAQGYGYPGGYGRYGYGGWGGGGYGSTPQGSYAQGLGVFAAGAGEYNLDTAQANSINAQTLASWNEYIYQSQLNVNRKYHEKLAREKYHDIQARQKLVDQMRNNPTPEDLYGGDALNIALDEINNPKVYAKSLDSLKANLEGPSIRDIPFQYAAAAISTSIHDLVHDDPPAILDKPEFATDRAALKEVAAKIREKTDKSEAPDAGDVQKAQDLLISLRKKMESQYDYNTKGFAQGEKYLKAAFALTKMLQGPQMDFILAGSEKRKEVSLGELVTFMNSFNLRFGPADSPEQRAVYSTLIPLMTKARDEAAEHIASADPDAKPSDAHPHDFFSGMKSDDLESKSKVPAPPAPNN